MLQEGIAEKYYSATKEDGIEIYAHNPPTDGKMWLDGAAYYGVYDFRNAEQYEQYKNCGFTVLMAQGSSRFAGEDWETSAAKKVLDECVKAGVKKAIIQDEVLCELAAQEESLIGKQFASLADLDAFVEKRMRCYRQHEAFFGVQLASEPKYTTFQALGQVYRAIKRVCPNAFVQVDLAMMYFVYDEGYEPPYGEDYDFNQRYEAYVRAFFEATDADCVGAVCLPFEDGISEGTYPYYYRQWQILASVAKECGAKLQFTLQAYGDYVNGRVAHRYPSEAEMQLQLHTALGFGAKRFAYFQYFPSVNNQLLGKFNPGSWAIVAADGTPSALYPVVQKCNAMLEKVMPVMKNFVYVSDTYAAVSPFVSKPMHIKFTLRNQLQNAEIETSSELAMAYELYDEKRAQYLYVIHNITCPIWGKGLSKQKTKITFNKPWTKVDVFDGETWRSEDLENGTFTAELDNCEAVYLLPY